MRGEVGKATHKNNSKPSLKLNNCKYYFVAFTGSEPRSFSLGSNIPSISF